MNSCITCKEAIEHCMSTHTFAFAHLYGDEKIMDMHIHNCCEVYYSISGGKQFLIDHCLYDIRPGDLFLINQFESHHLTQIDQQTHERIILSIDPEYLSKLSTGVTNLGHCFSFRDTRMPHQIHLSPKEQNRFIYFIHELHDDGGMGEDLLDQAIFLELMVFLNRAFAARCTDAAAPAAGWIRYAANRTAAAKKSTGRSTNATSHLPFFFSAASFRTAPSVSPSSFRSSHPIRRPIHRIGCGSQYGSPNSRSITNPIVNAVI